MFSTLDDHDKMATTHLTSASGHGFDDQFPAIINLYFIRDVCTVGESKHHIRAGFDVKEEDTLVSGDTEEFIVLSIGRHDVIAVHCKKTHMHSLKCVI